jgi:acyl-coenzyme A synthetase/AMP-(fatty) acid ligase
MRGMASSRLRWLCLEPNKQRRRYAAFSISLLGVISCFFSARAGLGKGDTVTLMLPNRADFYVPVLAAWRCGAAVSLVDPLQQPGQVPFLSRKKPEGGQNRGRIM